MENQTIVITGKIPQRFARKETPTGTRLDEHFRGYPDPKNGFSIFEEDWQHFKLIRVNDETELSVDRLNDQLIPFCVERLGGLEGKTVLELGPYEGFHSYGLVQHGAREVTSIEANPRNYLKCLTIKNYFKLDPVTYLLGDFAPFLSESETRYDFVLAAGVLYHLSEPFWVLNRIMEKTDAIGICTTYYDQQHQKFEFTGETREVVFPGTEPFVLHKRPNSPGTKRRKQGIDKFAWMFSRADLLRFLEFRKFHYEIRELPDRAHLGPRIQLFAHR